MGILTTSLCWLMFAFQAETPLAEELFTIDRDPLQVEPAIQSILIGEDGPPVVFRLTYSGSLQASWRYKASLTGPGLSAPVTFDVPAQDGQIVIPRSHFNVEGSFTLANIRLTSGSDILALSNPESVEIQAAENFLLTEVTVEPLSEDQLEAMGYVFSDDDYISVNFRITMVTDSREFVVETPVVYPRDETSVVSPQVLENPFNPYFRTIPVRLPERKDDSRYRESIDDILESPRESLKKPDYLPGLIMIPGNFNYLKSHFAVTCAVLNAAPEGFDVTIDQLKAKIVLPQANDEGFPLTIRESVSQNMVNAGSDEEIGTADDRDFIRPGQRAQATYVVRGEQPGMHDVEILVEGRLKLPQGEQPVSTVANATVLVRSPEFTVQFETPESVADGDNFDLVVVVQNTGEVNLDGFSMTLDPDGIIGATLRSHPVQSLPAVPPGETGILTFQCTSRKTGNIFTGFFQSGPSTSNDYAVKLEVGRKPGTPLPYFVTFPDNFFTQFPSDLANALRLYVRNAMNAGQLSPNQLEPGQLPISVSAVQNLAKLMGFQAKAAEFGYPQDQRTTKLFSLWARSVREYEPLDRFRRLAPNGGAQVEQLFGQHLASYVSQRGPSAFLQFLMQENEDAPNLFVWIVKAPSSLPLAIDMGGQALDSNGSRDIPFGSMLTLDSQTRLVWISGADVAPRLILGNSGMSTTSGVSVWSAFRNPQRQARLVSLTNITLQAPLELLAVPSQSQVVRGTAPNQETLDSSPIPVKPFQLVDVVQVPIVDDPKVDIYGRDFWFLFSKPVDLKSLRPLEEHIFLGGKPIVDAKLMADGRTLAVSARMPLGPYRPISYSLKNIQSLDGLSLNDSGSFQGDPSRFGVTISGRIADHNGADLSQAEVHLWMRDANLPVVYPPRVFNTVSVNNDGTYDIDFSPIDPFFDETTFADEINFLENLWISVLLEDGRYQKRELYPQAPGQSMVVDFAFLQEGSVEGQILSETGQPIPFAPVFVRNLNNGQYGAQTTTNELGRYHVDGIEVGQVVVQSSTGQIVGTNSGYLTAETSPLTIDVIISSPVGTIAGIAQFQKTDGSLHPIVNGYVGYQANGTLLSVFNLSGNRFLANAIVSTVDAGRFVLPNMPAGTGTLFFFQPDIGYEERLIQVEPGQTTTVDFVVSDFQHASIAGVVEGPQGQRLGGVLVVADGTSVTTNSLGEFRLDYLAMNTTVRITAQHPQYGQTDTLILADQTLISGVRLAFASPVLVSGHMQDADGQPKAFKPVFAIRAGNAPQLIAETRADGSWDGQVPGANLYKFTSIIPPYIFATPQISITDSGLDNIIITGRPRGDLKVRVVDGSGAPVVAKVNLGSEAPNLNQHVNQPLEDPSGLPIFEETYVDQFTDENGEIILENINAGYIEVFAHIGELGDSEIISQEFVPAAPGEDPPVITLFFGDALEPANLFGRVMDTDGQSVAPAGTQIQVTGPGVNRTTTVEADGSYRFEDLIATSEPVRLTLLALHPDSNHYDVANFDLNQDLNFRYDILLKRRSSANIRVEQADGSPVETAGVLVSYLNVLADPANDDGEGISLKALMIFEEYQITSPDQVLRVENIPAGSFSVKVKAGNGLVGLRAFDAPAGGAELDVLIPLEAASSIAGLFTDHDGFPITDAEIRLFESARMLQVRLSSNESGNEGRFLFDELPIRNYRLQGVDPQSALEANAPAATTPYRPDIFVDLQLDPVANIEGQVLLAGVPQVGATVTLQAGSFNLLTGTNLDGRFAFGNLPLGEYQLRASAAGTQDEATLVVTLDQAFTTVQQTIELIPAHDLLVRIETPEGNPVPNILVTAQDNAEGPASIFGNSGFTDADGRVLLTGFPAGNYMVLAEHPNEPGNIQEQLIVSNNDPQQVERTFRFPGWARIEGTVLGPDGQPLDRAIQVNLTYNSYPIRAIFTDNEGFFSLGRVPLRQYRASAFNRDTFELAYLNIDNLTHGETRQIQFQLRASSFVSGQVLRQDGQPAPYALVEVRDPVRVSTLADADGRFQLDPVLEGLQLIEARDESGRAAIAQVELIRDGALVFPVRNLVLTLGGVGTISGQVMFPDNHPLRMGSVHLSPQGAGSAITAPVQGDGSFIFRNLPVGTYSSRVYDGLHARFSDTADIALNQDNQTINPQLILDPAFTLSGQILLSNGIDPAPGAAVTLLHSNITYRSVANAVLTGPDGTYSIPHVYAGNYTVEVKDAAVELVYNSPFVMPNQNYQFDATLRAKSWILGAIADASQQAFSSGTLLFTQNGNTRPVFLNLDGSFRVDDLTPGAYTLSYSVANGWISNLIEGVLDPGLNNLPITTADTVEITGRAIVIADHLIRPQLTFYSGTLARSERPANDGRFTLARVPVGLDIDLEMRTGNLLRRVELGTISGPLNTGDLYLDATPPSVTFAQSGATISSLPFRFDFSLLESDTQSAADTARTRVWVNGAEISHHFAPSGDDFSANFQIPPDAFVPGLNQVSVQVFNQHGATTTHDFQVDLALNGVTLVVDLLRGGLPVPGEVRLDQAQAVSTDAAGRAIFSDITAGQLTLRARSGQVGARQFVTLAGQVTRFVQLELYEYGEYRGTVRDLNGQPLPGASVQIGNERETSDASGQYSFDLLPLGNHEMVASGAQQIGYRLGDNLNLNGQVLIDQDIDMLGTAAVYGRVLDGDGSTPIADAQVQLTHPGLSPLLDRITTADAQGNYRIENVPATALELTATEPGQSARLGRASGTISANGVDLNLDIQLAPVGTLELRLVDLSGNPVGDLPVSAFSGGSRFDATTDFDGLLRLDNLPHGEIRLEAERRELLAYLDHTLILNQTLLNAGDIAMQADQPPQITQVSVTDPYSPTSGQGLFRFQADDDRALGSYTIAISGVHHTTLEGSYQNRSNTIVEDYTPRWFSLPSDTPQGTAQFVITLYDHFGQTTTFNGSFQVIQDQTPPVVTIQQPLDGGTYAEGDPLQIQASAADSSGIASVTASLDGQIVGTSQNANLNLSTYLPARDSDGPVVLQVTAQDRAGNQGSTSVTLQVTAVQSSGAPQITLLAPVADQPLPLDLDGFQLQVAVRALDPDGLGFYRVLLDGQEAATGRLPGTENLFDIALPLSAQQAVASSLLVQVEIDDLGGNLATAQATVLPFGNYTVFDAQNPLVAPSWDLSNDGLSILLNGGNHIISGTHQYQNMLLTGGAVLSQNPAQGDQTAQTQIALDGLLMLDYGSQINLVGTGPLNPPIGVVSQGGDPSHAGLGSRSDELGQVYGSPFMPQQPGMGNGGGALKISATNSFLLGDIHADGDSSRGSVAGAGGSIWLQTNTLSGFGTLTANGFSLPYPAGESNSANNNGSGGGRIAIWSDNAFAGTLQAMGSPGSGAGTIYQRTTDAQAPRGYRDHLVVANHPQAQGTNATQIPIYRNLVVGTDVLLETRFIDNREVQTATFINPSQINTDLLLGMQLYGGSFESGSPIVNQDGLTVFSPPDDPFGTFAAGDLLHLDFRVDQLTVSDHAILHAERHQFTDQLTVRNGTLHTGPDALDLDSFSTDLSQGALLVGTFTSSDIQTNGQSFGFAGTWQTGDLDLQSGNLLIDGTLSAPSLNLGPDAGLSTPSDRSDAVLHLNIPQLTLSGNLVAHRNGSLFDDSGKLRNNHGGLIVFSAQPRTYGTLYQPVEVGRGAGGGGAILLDFDSLTLDGSLSADAVASGSGGSILLRGNQLSGTGSLSADGYIGVDSGAGGRIAILVDDQSGFSGSAGALGNAQGGAGTVFMRSAQWPNGRLQVDNGGTAAPAGSTLLPALGFRTLDADTDGSTISAQNLPDFNSLHGLYLENEAGTTARIAANSTTSLTPETQFPTMTAGTPYHGLHILDVLEVRGGASLRTADVIQVLQTLDSEGGLIEAAELRLPSDATRFEDGALELLEDPGFENLELSNFHLTVHFPLNLTDLTLENNSRLTYRDVLTAETITVDASTLEAMVDSSADGLLATNLTMRNNALWEVGDLMADGRAYSLTAQVSQQLQVDASSRISAGGLAAKTTTKDQLWAGQTLPRGSHGGLQQGDFFIGLRTDTTSPLLGSFALPEGNLTRGMGGSLRLTAAQIHLDGTISADAAQDSRNDGPGGGVLIRGGQVSGSGRITARPSNSLLGGGRIAIYYNGNSNQQPQWQFATRHPSTSDDVFAQQGAGTIFFKGDQQAYGTLRADQESGSGYLDDRHLRNRRYSGIPGLSGFTMTIDDGNPDPLIITDATRNDLPQGLAGQYVVFELDNTTYQSRILANSHNSLTLETPVPAIVPAGTAMRLELQLDQLQLANGGHLFYPGTVRLNTLVGSGSITNGLWANRLEGMNHLQLNDQKLRLVLDHTDHSALDVTLTNSQLLLDKPTNFNNLTLLQNSQVSHSPALNGATPDWVGLTLGSNSISADSSSGFNVSGRGQFSHPVYSDINLSHGGSDQNGRTYGSPFYPDQFGAGTDSGGRMHLMAGTIQGGNYRADGNGAGGSIWIEAGTLSGDIALSAGSQFGGGRAALYYDQSSAQISAATDGNGAGTYFAQNRSEAFGTLQIATATATDSNPSNTPLPAIPLMTLPAGTSTQTTGVNTLLTIPDLTIAEHFRGYYLVVNGDQNNPIPIASAYPDGTAAVFELQGLHTLATGDQIQMALRLFDVSTCLHCTTGPADLLFLVQPRPETFPAGHVFENGSGTFQVAPSVGDNRLVLDGYLMTVQGGGANYDHVELRNGARLLLQGLGGSGDLNTNILDLNGSILEVETITAGTITMAAAAEINVTRRGTPQLPTMTADNLTVTSSFISADHLAVSQTLNLSSGSYIEGYTLDYNAFEWPAGNVLHNSAAGISFGGVGQVRDGVTPTDPPNYSPAVGSFSKPWLQAHGYKSVKVTAGDFVLNGRVIPNRLPASSDPGGGAVWIEAQSLSGTGTINADARNVSVNGFRPGAGRIAVHAGTSTFTGRMDALGTSSGGSGTVFFKTSDQSYGTLSVVETGITRGNSLRTAIPALESHILGANATVEGATLSDPDASFPYALAGLYLVFDDQGTEREFLIEDNTPTSITVQGNLPPLPVGTRLTARLHLDALELGPGARLQVRDHLVLHGDIQWAPRSTSKQPVLWARDVTFPSTALSISNQAIGLAIEGQTNLQHLDLFNVNFLSDMPLHLDSIALRGSTFVTHDSAKPFKARVYPRNPAVDWTLSGALTIEANAKIDTASRGYGTIPLDELWGVSATTTVRGEHGGYTAASAGAYPYGSFVEPKTYGNTSGAGRIAITAQSIQADGNILASGSVGGAIFLNVGTLSGSGAIAANSTSFYSGGRVAIHFQQNLLSTQPTASSGVMFGVQSGAGTVYLFDKSSGQGQLLAINSDAAISEILETPLMALGSHTLTQAPPDPSVIVQPDANWRNGFAGYYIEDLATGERYRVVDHTADTLFLERPVFPAPGPGWAYRGIIPVHQMQTANARVTHTDPFDDSQPPVIQSILVDPLPAGKLDSGTTFQVLVQIQEEGFLEQLDVSFNGQTQSVFGQTNAVFSFTAPNVAVETLLNIDVTAIDGGFQSTSDSLPVSVLPPDNQPPAIELLDPAPGSALTGLSSFTTTIRGTDNRLVGQIRATFGGFTQIHNLPSGSQLPTIETQFQWLVPNPDTTTNMPLDIQVTDQVGNTTTSQETFSISPVAQNGPNALLVQPADDSYRAVDLVPLEILVADPATVASVSIQFASQPAVELTAAPFSTTLSMPPGNDWDVFPLVVTVTGTDSGTTLLQKQLKLLPADYQKSSLTLLSPQNGQTFTAGQRIVVSGYNDLLDTGFEGQTDLEPFTQIQHVADGSQWQLSSNKYSGSQAVEIFDQPNTFADLISAPITLGPNALLSFYHRLNISRSWEGGQLILVVDGQDVPLDDQFLLNGYNRTMTSSASPLLGQRMWSVISSRSSWHRVEVDLSPWAGQTVQLKWRFAADASLNNTSWSVDQILLRSTLGGSPFSHMTLAVDNGPSAAVDPNAAFLSVSAPPVASAQSSVLKLTAFNQDGTIQAFVRRLTVEPDLTAPQLAVTTPAENALLTGGDSLLTAAAASDRQPQQVLIPAVDVFWTAVLKDEADPKSYDLAGRRVTATSNDGSMISAPLFLPEDGQLSLTLSNNFASNVQSAAVLEFQVEGSSAWQDVSGRFISGDYDASLAVVGDIWEGRSVWQTLQSVDRTFVLDFADLAGQQVRFRLLFRVVNSTFNKATWNLSATQIDGIQTTAPGELQLTFDFEGQQQVSDLPPFQVQLDVPSVGANTPSQLLITARDSSGNATDVTVPLTIQPAPAANATRIIASAAAPRESEEVQEDQAAALELTGRRVRVSELNLQPHQSLWLINSTLVADADLILDTLHVNADSQIIAPPSEVTTPRVFIKASGLIEIDATSVIQLDGVAALPVEDDLLPAHGGFGRGEENRQDPYDSPIYPVMTGSGSHGGGLIILVADQLLLNGAITARGQYRSSGGTVTVSANTVRGRGLIDVSGGQLIDTFSGGGRVALHGAVLQWFLGTVVTGHMPHATGSLILGEPGEDGVYLFPGLIDGRPMPWPTAPAVLPSLALEPDQWTLLPGSTAIQIREPQPELQYAAGLWLRHGNQTRRITQVQLEKDILIIMLDAELEIEQGQPAAIFLKNLNPLPPSGAQHLQTIQVP